MRTKMITMALLLLSANAYSLSVAEYRKHAEQNPALLDTYLEGLATGFYFGNVVANNKLGAPIYCVPDTENQDLSNLAQKLIDSEIQTNKYAENDSVEILFVIGVQDKYPCKNKPYDHDSEITPGDQH
jgi:hypothetical protein